MALSPGSTQTPLLADAKNEVHDEYQAALLQEYTTLFAAPPADGDLPLFWFAVSVGLSKVADDHLTRKAAFVDQLPAGKKIGQLLPKPTKQGYVEIVTCLIKHKANLEEYAQQTLATALKDRNLPAIKCMHEAKIDCVTAKNEWGNTALDTIFDPRLVQTVFPDSNLEIAQFLLEQKADPNVFPKTKSALLTRAAKVCIGGDPGGEKVVRTMLEAKADPKLTGDDKLTALMGAAKVNNGAMLKLLIPMSDVNATDRHGATALNHLLPMVYPPNPDSVLLENVKLLLDAKADPTSKDHCQTTPLIVAETFLKKGKTQEEIYALLRARAQQQTTATTNDDAATEHSMAPTPS